jgi:hypothetical protein
MGKDFKPLVLGPRIMHFSAVFRNPFIWLENVLGGTFVMGPVAV